MLAPGVPSEVGQQRRSVGSHGLRVHLAHLGIRGIPSHGSESHWSGRIDGPAYGPTGLGTSRRLTVQKSSPPSCGERPGSSAQKMP